MKRMIALALCLLMACTLMVGCGSSAPATTTAPAANDAPAAEAPTAPAEKITFSISHSYTELDQVSVELNNAAKAISERTNGNVTAIF